MGIFDGISNIFKNLFSINGDVWVIRIAESYLDLDTCNGVAVEDTLNNTCSKCVALNNTVFKNNNKPDYYHPYCQCKNKEYNFIESTLIFDENKVKKYFF